MLKTDTLMSPCHWTDINVTENTFGLIDAHRKYLEKHVPDQYQLHFATHDTHICAYFRLTPTPVNLRIHRAWIEMLSATFELLKHTDRQLPDDEWQEDEKFTE